MRNGSFWMMIKDPQDGRKVLVEYDPLRPKHKEKIQAKFGNPYEYLAKEPIKKLIVTDFKAQEFYINYRYNDNKSLPVEHISKYTSAASWLNMLIRVTVDSSTIKQIIKQVLHLTVDKFYNNVIDITKAEDLPLPKTYSHLLRKIKEYKTEGYGCLIDWRFGNTNSKKVDDEVAESVLLGLIAHPNQYDDMYISMQYNEWAVKNNRDTITDQTVGNYRRRNNHLIITDREGKDAFYNKYVRQVKRLRPSTPLYLCNHDDNHLDLYFIDIADKTQAKHYKKYKAIIVIDPFNDHVLGYAYDLRISNDLIKKAYLNAMYYIRSLTGGWYLPHEIKSDRFGSQELKPFYQSMGNYVDTPVGSKGSGYIEQCFSRPFFKRCLKMGANNYSGNNITAINDGVNREVLKLNKDLRPTIDESAWQIENFFYRLRHMPPKQGVLSKEQEWLNAWNNTPEEKKKHISDETFLLIFGTVANEKGITITNRGVEPQINNIQYSYDLPHEIMSQYIGMKVKVIYDPNNTDRVLLTNFKDFRCIATSPKYVASAMADYKEGSRTDLNKILNYKRQQVEYAAEKSTQRKQILVENNIDVEAILQAGVPIAKELKQQAEELNAAGFIERKQMVEQYHEYLEQKTDFDKYLTD